MASRANADIAPDPMTGGWPVTPYDEETTDVRMVAEDVTVRIYADSIVTVASFSMSNEGKTTDMVVGFPFPYEKDLLRSRAFVDGQPVAVKAGIWHGFFRVPTAKFLLPPKTLFFMVSSVVSATRVAAVLRP